MENLPGHSRRTRSRSSPSAPNPGESENGATEQPHGPFLSPTRIRFLLRSHSERRSFDESVSERHNREQASIKSTPQIKPFIKQKTTSPMANQATVHLSQSFKLPVRPISIEITDTKAILRKIFEWQEGLASARSVSKEGRISSRPGSLQASLPAKSTKHRPRDVKRSSSGNTRSQPRSLASIRGQKTLAGSTVCCESVERMEQVQNKEPCRQEDCKTIDDLSTDLVSCVDSISLEMEPSKARIACSESAYGRCSFSTVNTEAEFRRSKTGGEDYLEPWDSAMELSGQRSASAPPHSPSDSFSHCAGNSSSDRRNNGQFQSFGSRSAGTQQQRGSRRGNGNSHRRGNRGQQGRPDPQGQRERSRVVVTGQLRYPCVYHREGEEDKTPDCKTRKSYVSQLRRHHERHDFFYCNKCFMSFATKEARTDHCHRSNAFCFFRCVTAGCHNYDTIPQLDATHAMACEHGRENKQLDQWRYLFHMAHPNEAVIDPEPEITTFSPAPQQPLPLFSPQSSKEELPVMQPTSAARPAPVFQISDVRAEQQQRPGGNENLISIGRQMIYLAEILGDPSDLDPSEIRSFEMLIQSASLGLRQLHNFVYDVRGTTTQPGRRRQPDHHTLGMSWPSATTSSSNQFSMGPTSTPAVPPPTYAQPLNEFVNQANHFPQIPPYGPTVVAPPPALTPYQSTPSEPASLPDVSLQQSQTAPHMPYGLVNTVGYTSSSEMSPGDVGSEGGINLHNM